MFDWNVFIRFINEWEILRCENIVNTTRFTTLGSDRPNDHFSGHLYVIL